MRTTHDKVLYILENYPETRNSDKLLIAQFWRCFHSSFVASNEYGDWVRLDHVIELTSSETICRDRRLIQAKSEKYPEGRFLPTDPKVLEERSKKAKGVQFTINSEDPDRYLPN